MVVTLARKSTILNSAPTSNFDIMIFESSRYDSMPDNRVFPRQRGHEQSLKMGSESELVGYEGGCTAISSST